MSATSPTSGVLESFLEHGLRMSQTSQSRTVLCPASWRPSSNPSDANSPTTERPPPPAYRPSMRSILWSLADGTPRSVGPASDLRLVQCVSSWGGPGVSR